MLSGPTTNKIDAKVSFDSVHSSVECAENTNDPDYLFIECDFGVIPAGQSREKTVTFLAKASASCGDSIVYGAAAKAMDLPNPSVIQTTSSKVTTTLVCCGNNQVDPDEQCDDGNQTNGDGCENDCSFTPAAASPMTVEVLSLPDSGTVSAGQTDIKLLRFKVTAGDKALLLRTSMFSAATGDLASIENPSLWRDVNGDGTVDEKALDKSTNSTQSILVFHDTADNTLRQIPAHQSAIFEVHGDVISPLGAAADFQLQFASDLANYLGAFVPADGSTLSGIRTDGLCLLLCDIDVTTAASTLWHLVP
jgi:cysteine-rich repeat protein